MLEKRFYQRTTIKIDCSIILKDGDKGYIETDAMIEDISEGGVGIFVLKEWDEQYAENIIIGDNLQFQAVDEYLLFNEPRVDIFSGEAKIVRIDRINGKLSIGCKFYRMDEELKEYIKNKETALFFDNMLK